MSELWDNMLYSVEDRLEMAIGAIKFRVSQLSAANQRIAEQAEEIAKAQADAKWNRDLWKKSEDKADALYLENKKLRAYKEECEKAEAVAWMMPTVPVRIVDHPNFNANYGAAVTPLYTRPSPDLQKKVEEWKACCERRVADISELNRRHFSEIEELKRKLAEQQALLSDARKLPEGWAEAVNLARNLSTGEWNQISTKGVLALCDAILRVDAIQVAPKQLWCGTKAGGEMIDMVPQNQVDKL